MRSEQDGKDRTIGSILLLCKWIMYHTGSQLSISPVPISSDIYIGTFTGSMATMHLDVLYFAGWSLS